MALPWVHAEGSGREDRTNLVLPEDWHSLEGHLPIASKKSAPYSEPSRHPLHQPASECSSLVPAPHPAQARPVPSYFCPRWASAGQVYPSSRGNGTYLTLVVRMRPACCSPVRAMYSRRISLVPCGQQCEGQKLPPGAQGVTLQQDQMHWSRVGSRAQEHGPGQAAGHTATASHGTHLRS